MDTATGLTILGTAIGSAKVVEKVLGPTADYLGCGLRDFTENRVKNIARIIKIAAKRLDDRIDRPGRVPPKALKLLLDDGGFCDDPLAAEYFGGVLASSRTEVTCDDRGACILALVQRLSVYQLKMHFILYSLVRQTYLDQRMTANLFHKIQDRAITIPIEHLVTAMAFGGEDNRLSILAHALTGLQKESLSGTLDPLPNSQRRTLGKRKIIFVPTFVGVELFLWAHGRGDLGINKWLRSTVVFPPLAEILLPTGIEPLNLEDYESAPSNNAVNRSGEQRGL